jgi:hypothetical protein
MLIVNTKKTATILGGAFVMMVTVAAYSQTATRSPYTGATAAVVDRAGNMQVLSNYRTDYQMLGTWAVAADKGAGSKELHVVYASPGATTAYRKSGRFPDGSVLVKEVFKATTKPMTTGTVSSADVLEGWFVMVKDDVGRFPQNKLWGEGWGWAWFDAANPKKTTSTDYKKDCQSCHVPAKATDWIFTNGYPPLR